MAASDLPQPIRFDVWTGRSLFEAGRELARTDHPSVSGESRRLIGRLQSNQQAIRDNYLITVASAEAGEDVTPAAEWLIDNHHMVEENLRQLLDGFNRRFLRRLPRQPLSQGGSAPRAMVIAWYYVALTNSEISPESLTEFLRGYQTETTLNIAELWAVPTFLRYVLIENLRRVADRVGVARQRRRNANELADELTALEGGDQIRGALERDVALLRDDTVAAQLLYRMRDAGSNGQVALQTIDRLLGTPGAAGRAVEAEYARQSTSNVTVGNIMRSLRRMGDVDWLDWFEGVSLVDALLAKDSEFAQLDQPTRTTYRDTIERISRRSALTEMQVAERALEAASLRAAEGAPVEVGHLLVGARRRAFAQSCGYRPNWRERIGRAMGSTGVAGLVITLAALTALLVWVAALALPDRGLGPWALGLLLLSATLVASETAMRLMGFLTSRIVPPRRLPALDFRAGVPEQARTLVVIPGMLSSTDAVDELAQMLESHYLANPLGAVGFALLTDWRDSPTETEADDQELLDHAIDRIEELADRYGHGGVRRFFLLHRRRLWNPAEGVWMGWERKRGKLEELNALLRGETVTTFLPTGPTPPEGVRYVVTLDSDTRLPRDAVSTLAGKMAHPVNRPVHDEDGLVVSGHGIMQPRVTPSLTTGAEASVFQRVFSVNRGLDPYVFTVSDLYQDLFDVGSFTGKGIYDVDAFQRAGAGRMPENAVLSHDLLEGSLARAALVTDVEVVEDFPLRYATEASRQHRWIRGDWQLLPFIVNPRNGLDGLARFKMVDNLRRSLVAPGFVLASLTGWLTLHGAWPLLWQAMLILLLALVAILQIDLSVITRPHGSSAGYHLRQMLRDARNYLTELGLNLTTIAHRAARSLDAIGRTLARLVTRRHLLEWTPAREAGRGPAVLGNSYRAMWASVAIGVLALVATALVNPVALPVALALGGLWIAAPWIMHLASRPLETRDRLQLSPEGVAELRRIGRLTWRYFDEFVGPGTNHLPPDNFQETPQPKLAERTSPTNIGLYLMSAMSAHDLGWIGVENALRRIDATLSTMERMPRFKGHFFNWYDTRTLAVLPHPYVSSVDSGNLAGALIALASGLRDWAGQAAAVRQPRLRGIADTLGVLRSRVEGLPAPRRAVRELRRTLDTAIASFAVALGQMMAGSGGGSHGHGQLRALAADIDRLAADLDGSLLLGEGAEVAHWARALARHCDDVLERQPEGREALEAFALRVQLMAERARMLAFQMDFAMLVDPDKMLLSVGYRPDAEQLDDSCYDLLASEARLTSFLAVAKGDLRQEHWRRLGRPFANIGNDAALLSWSGCMFEYLMPPLLLKERQGGILDHSNRMAVDVQIDWGRARGLPWGVSESAFNARDRDMNYQYYAFGVPALALKRPGNDQVVAPYASIMAAQIRPQAALRNLAGLRALGAEGPRGFYDAVDFTRSRLRDGANHSIVRNVMAHHHGMSILAIANAVLDGIHRDRFHNDPVVRASELMLQEKSPRDIVPVTRSPSRAHVGLGSGISTGDTLTVVDNPAAAEREVGLMSNGRFSTLISSTGAGRSMLGDFAVNRWSPDPTRDDGGIYIMMRDAKSNEWWSASAAPCSGPNERASAIFSDHKAEFFKTANAIESRLEVTAATEADADGRRLTLRNRSGSDRTIEITSYGEIVLDAPAADRAHPAFSKMFVETEIRDGGALIVAQRKPRDPKGQARYFAHLIADSTSAGMPPTEAETDRRNFIGRGRSLADPVAFDPGAALRGGQGHTLDPCFAIRRRVRVPAGKTVSLTFWTLVADSAERRDRLAAHYVRSSVFDNELRLAWTYSQVQLRHLGVSLEDARLFRRFAALLIWPDMRLALEGGADGRMGPQSALWPLGISGDDPILLIRIDNEGDLPIVRQALRMHQFLRARGVSHDVVVLNERASSYIQDLQHQLKSLIDAAEPQRDGPCYLHAVRRDQISDESFQTLLAAARIVLHTRNGRLAEQIERLSDTVAPVPDLRPAPRRDQPRDPRPVPPSQSQLDYWNGYGGFAPGGREYVVRTTRNRPTPQPWINVIARDGFGFHVSAEGAPYSWAVNSRDFQISPWSNDPLVNRPGEGLWVYDRDSGRIASPFLALAEDDGAVYEAAHGLGYSRFTADHGWVALEAVMTLAEDQPARLTRLTVHNRTDRRLRLRGAAFVELVLGNDRARSAPMIRARFDEIANALTARNPFSADFADRIVALSCDRPIDAVSASRAGFLGRGGSMRRPAGLDRWPPARPEGELGTEGDPGAAIRWTLDIEPGQSAATTVILAEGTAETLPDTLRATRAPGAAARGLAAAEAEWGDLLGSLQVETPDPKLDLMVNAWLPYQSLGCRIRARTGFYQASGAFGFRDQLQDTAAMLLQDPSLCRKQLLNAASRQFVEGDVQHWWLPRSGAGVRTMISDDVVWLGHITAQYIAATGDTGLLDEPVEFIAGPELAPGQHDLFLTPQPSGEIAPFYEHCARALDLAVARTGERGLPLILGGDWNDGMNRVGEEGRGESVWLGWFLCATIDAFAPLARARGDDARADAWAAHRTSVAAALDRAGWDGAWYRRGYFDDGTPLGSAESEECRIDSIAQSWALLSGAGRPDRAATAVNAALDQLFDRDAGLMRLFTPPFARSDVEPGYIKAYPAGVRENGGQYTHAAMWMVYALGRSGDGQRAHRLFDAINPISHSADPRSADGYRVEPYVAVADIYAGRDKLGRGGWTWYTGSAGWMYRAAVEGILGIQRRAGGFTIDPNLPPDWPGFTATLRLAGREYHLAVRQERAGAPIVEVDGEPVVPGKLVRAGGGLARKEPPPALETILSSGDDPE
ncbi:protein ndvB [Paracoccus sp. Z118]|uniref:GH36-type glycosyl hydrolase domain-containing protein n=1 Tax=Paracoccus sp. Z118 TaxID=2851017 RepID=UPI001C2C268F|nr:glucoamylase family protein [Paracoccus sp. Z118]MBV0891977.1 protein ndvB [Paracoccus sp. Z118]